MVLKGKYAGMAAAIVAGIAAMTSVTPAQARRDRVGVRFYRSLPPGQVVVAGSSIYGTRLRPRSFARAAHRYYASGYGGYLRYQLEDGVLVADYAGIPVPDRARVPLSTYRSSTTLFPFPDLAF